MVWSHLDVFRQALFISRLTGRKAWSQWGKVKASLTLSRALQLFFPRLFFRVVLGSKIRDKLSLAESEDAPGSQRCMPSLPFSAGDFLIVPENFWHNSGIPYAPYSFRVRIRIRVRIMVRVRD